MVPLGKPEHSQQSRGQTPGGMWADCHVGRVQVAWNRERHVPLHPQRLSILQVRKLRHGARVTAKPTRLPGQSCLHSVQRHEALLTISCPLGGRSLDFPENQDSRICHPSSLQPRPGDLGSSVAACQKEPVAWDSRAPAHAVPGRCSAKPQPRWLWVW